MNTPKKTSGYPASSYGSVPNSGNPRYTEAWALIETARRMAATTQNLPADDKQAKDTVRDALRLNWRLWTIFQTELSLEDDGAVPDEIRQNMLSLCNFVDRHTVETIADPQVEKVMVLVEMNRNIAGGLLDSIRNNPQQAEPPASAEHQERQEQPAETASTDEGPSPNEEKTAPSPAAPLSFDEDI